MVTSREFSTYGSPLEMVTSFVYLGRVISSADKKLAGGGPESVKGAGGAEEDDEDP